jgi:hypothetical protein
MHMHIEHKLLTPDKPRMPGTACGNIESLLLTAVVIWGGAGRAWGQGADLVGWGRSEEGQMTSPVNLTGVTQVACGYYFTYALKNDGSLVGWGYNGEGQIDTPSNATGVTQVACGYYHTYALREDGTLIGWGWNNFGQIRTPTNLADVKQVACGLIHTYALKIDGTLVGWGSNNSGQISTPSNLSDIKQVACGSSHTYALKSDGSLVGWGFNGYGQTNTPSGLTNVTQIACGAYHTYALKNDGSAVGWGYDRYGQTNTPSNATHVTQIACGGYHTYAVKSDGTIVGWGFNAYGQVSTPKKATSITQIACGDHHTYALRAWSDCNANGIHDGDDIALGGHFDFDQNGVPDTCQGASQFTAHSGDLGAPNPLKPTSFTFAGLRPSDTDASLFITATGDFDASNEYLTVRLADSGNPLGYITLGRLFEVGGRNCAGGSNAGTITVPKDTFNRLAASGQLTIILVPSPPVTLGECPNGSMNVSLSYLGIGPDGDCDHDGRLDSRQIGEDRSIDSNLNSRIDSCEYAKGDFDLNGEVDTADLSLALLYLGEVDSLFGDLDGDGTVTTADVSLLLMNFGSVVWP